MPGATISKSFGLAVRKRRCESGLSQEELAERAGLHPTYISMVERGVRNVTLEVASRIAKALKISLTRLVDEALHANRKTKEEEPQRTRGNR